MAINRNSHATDEQPTLRRYLLGLATAAEQLRIEERLLVENDFLEELEIAEEDLLDSYVNDTLAPAERRQMEAHFQFTPERQRKLQFARALKHHTPQPEEIVKGHSAFAQITAQLRAGFHLLPVWGWAGAAILLLAGSGFFLWQLTRPPAPPPELAEGLASLQAAYRNERPLQPRLAGFAHAAFRELRGGTTASEAAKKLQQEKETELDSAGILLRRAATTRPGPATYHALGQYHLAKLQFDQAIEMLDKAASAAPHNAALQSDLGVAWLEKARATSRTAMPTNPALPSGAAPASGQTPGKMLEEFASSLEHFNRALELNDKLPEALFNRALCQEFMMLPQQATQAEADWRRYLELDGTSPWADEARDHLKALENQKKSSGLDRERLWQEFLAAYQAHDDVRAGEIARRSRLRSGHLLAERVIDEYLSASQPNPATLRPLAYLGEVELRLNGDRFISQQAQLYQTSTPTQRSLLTQARQRLKSAANHSGRSDYESAINDYQQARALFEQARAPGEVALVSLYLGRSYLRQTKLKQCEAVLTQLAATSQQQAYRWLYEETLNAFANLQVSQNEYSRSIQSSTQALERAEQLRDTHAIWDNLITLADEHRYLGDYSHALGYLERTLRYAETSQPDLPAIRRLYTGLALNFLAEGYNSSALTLQKEILALELAKPKRSPIVLNRIYAQLSLTYGKLHQTATALQHAQLALEQSAASTGPAESQEMQAYAALHLGELYRQAQQPTQALRYYQQAIDGYGELKYPFFAFTAQKGRWLTHLQQQDFAAAARELDPLLQLFESRRAQITGEQTRNSFFDSENDIYDLAVDFAYQGLNDPVRAFNYAESARARSLLDLLSTRSEVVRQAEQPDIRYTAVTQPLTLAEVQRQLPANVQLLHYAALKDRLLIWVISATKVETRVSPVSLDTLNQTVSEYLQQIAAANDASLEPTRQRARTLYQHLLSPVEPLLDRQATLCIIPDKILCHVPFNALLAPGSGRYLIEDFPVLLAPSASVFLASTERARALQTTTEESFLGIGDPRFNPQLFPGLQPLPAAETEIRQLADCYRNAPGNTQMLFGAAATEQAVTRRLPQASVIHFATHAVSQPHSPLLSTLVLAPEANASEQTTAGDGQLQACEIYQFKLPKTRLVVLSACQTGVERVYRGEGAVGLARPFIAAEVPLVIASFWPVESNFTASLMNDFHHRRRGANPQERLATAAALRQTQLAMLRNPDQRYQHPYYWAAFAIIGGDARF